MFCPIIKGECGSNLRNDYSCIFDHMGECQLTDLVFSASAYLGALTENLEGEELERYQTLMRSLRKDAMAKKMLLKFHQCDPECAKRHKDLAEWADEI